MSSRRDPAPEPEPEARSVRPRTTPAPAPAPVPAPGAGALGAAAAPLVALAEACVRSRVCNDGARDHWEIALERALLATWNAQKRTWASMRVPWAEIQARAIEACIRGRAGHEAGPRGVWAYAADLERLVRFGYSRAALERAEGAGPEPRIRASARALARARALSRDAAEEAFHVRRLRAACEDAVAAHADRIAELPDLAPYARISGDDEAGEETRVGDIRIEVDPVYFGVHVGMTLLSAYILRGVQPEVSDGFPLLRNVPWERASGSIADHLYSSHETELSTVRNPLPQTMHAVCGDGRTRVAIARAPHTLRRR